MVFLCGICLLTKKMTLFFSILKGTVTQIEKALINDRLRVSKAS